MNLQEIASMSAFIKQELTPLADKLGKSAEFTYGLFIKQVYVDAIFNLVWSVFGGIGLYFSTKWIKSIQKDDDYNNGGELLVAGLLWGISFIAIVLPIFLLPQVIINPDYQAIRLIIQTIQSVGK